MIFNTYYLWRGKEINAMNKLRSLSYLVFLLIICMGSAGAQSVRFTDVTKEAGIDFKYNFGDYTYENILESSGSGVTIFDYNNDGWMDIYLLNGTYLEGISDQEGIVFQNTKNELYKNNGDGTFTEVSIIAGVDDRHWSMAAGAFDYDGDGDQDLYLLNYGPNVFYRNDGDGNFTDITTGIGFGRPSAIEWFRKVECGGCFLGY
jgi:hypothetical protein